MSQIHVEEFAGTGPSDHPCLFTRTRQFRFHGEKGKLVHRTLPRGPKGYTVVAVTSTGHEARFDEQNRVALTIPLAGRSEVRVAGRVLATRPGGTFAIGPSERTSNLISQGAAGNYRSYTIISPPEHAGILGGECWLHRPNFPRIQKLKHLIDFSFRLFGGAHAIPAIRLALVEALIEDVFVDALTQPADNRNTKRDAQWYEWIVRAAQTCMESRFHLPLSVPDVAASVGVGPRTLQLAFHSRRGMTPKQFLTDVRLRAMHVRLTRPEGITTVTSAAMDSGIFHVGRCIDAYRKRYGESPATTLRRAKTPMRSSVAHEHQDPAFKMEW